MEDWLQDLKRCGAFVKEFMMDPRAFHASCRLVDGGVGSHFLPNNVNGETSYRANEISDGDAAHDADIGVVNHREDSILVNGIPKSDVSAVDETRDVCFQAETDEVDVDHAELEHGMYMPGNSFQEEIRVVDVYHVEMEHCMHMPGSSFQVEIHGVDVDHAALAHCEHLSGNSFQAESDAADVDRVELNPDMYMSDRVDELPSEVQDDIMELYSNFVEGVRAPDVRIEKVDVVSHVSYMEEDREEQEKEEEQENQEKEDELILDVNPQNSYGGKRKFPWTSEEEEMLEEGVKKFEKTRGKGKTTPWKMILQFGGGIFHTQRSAENLKDKWRRMCRERIGS